MILAEPQHDKADASPGSVSVPLLAKDRPNVLAPAPFILLATLFAGIILDNVVWIGLVAELPEIPRTIVGVALALIGARFSFRGLAALRSRGTHFEPWKPSLALATDGIFQRTRNPMYQGLCLVVLGVALVLRSDWTIILLVLTAPIIHYGLVRREERYLERKFGDDYLRFTKRVPRYDWLFWPSLGQRPLTKDWLAWMVAAAICFIAAYTGLWLSDQLIQALEQPGIRTAALARASVTDRASLAAAAKAAGLHRSSKVFAVLDETSRIDEGKVQVRGWAVERGGTGLPLTILVFIDGVKVLETKTRGGRPDITQTLRLSATNAKNVAFEDMLACRRGQKLYAAATTVSNRYMPLNSLDCP